MLRSYKPILISRTRPHPCRKPTPQRAGTSDRPNRPRAALENDRAEIPPRLDGHRTWGPQRALNLEGG